MMAGELPAEVGEGWDSKSCKVLLVGLARSGKSSIQKVVLNKMPPHETLFLESTKKVEVKQVAHNAFIQFKVCDFPGSYVIESTHDQFFFSKCGALIFVIDAQDEPYTEALAFAKKIITQAHKVNPKIFFEVFIHKVDGDSFLSEEYKTDCQREIHNKLTEELHENSVDAHLTFHCTSIYDHSVFESVSKVVQKLIPQLAMLEQLLDLLIAHCRMEKAFLFDVVSKIYIASDTQPVDIGTYELCSDMIDVVIDVSCIYGLASEDSSSIAYDCKSSCVIQLNNGLLLYLREVDRYVALACLIREENFERQHLVDYNIQVFKDSLLDVIPGGKRSAASSSKQV